MSGDNGKMWGIKDPVIKSPNMSLVPKMEVLTYISCMDTAYVRENPPPKWPYKVQYLHFRYLKLLVIKQPGFNGKLLHFGSFA